MPPFTKSVESLTGEVKTDLIEVPNGIPFISSNLSCTVITEEHSIADVIRWLLKQASSEELINLINDEIESELIAELANLEARRLEILNVLKKQ